MEVGKLIYLKRLRPLAPVLTFHPHKDAFIWDITPFKRLIFNIILTISPILTYLRGLSQHYFGSAVVPIILIIRLSYKILLIIFVWGIYYYLSCIVIFMWFHL